MQSKKEEQELDEQPDEQTEVEEPIEKSTEEEAPIDVEEFLTESIEELLKMAEPAQTFTASGGRVYKLSGLQGWRARQNRAAYSIWQMVEKDLRAATTGENRTTAFGAFLQALLMSDNQLWERFFSIMYIPVDADGYHEDKAPEYWDDMLDITNEVAIGALAFFATSSLSSIPRGILRFFQRQFPMVGVVIDSIKKHDVNAKERSTSPRESSLLQNSTT